MCQETGGLRGLLADGTGFENEQIDGRRRLLPQCPVERKTVDHGTKLQRGRIAAVLRSPFHRCGIVEQVTGRGERGDRRALVG